jgi:predicted GNAT family N-acyltransferase
MTDAEVRVAETAVEREAALAVRRAVFVEGQGVPIDRELDGKDEDAIHVVATDGDETVGTARVRTIDAETAKVERVAVIESRRGEGWGRRIMDRVEAEARSQGCSRAMLHAQLPVVSFYRARGYQTVGEEFLDTGVPHVEMTKPLAE